MLRSASPKAEPPPVVVPDPEPEPEPEPVISEAHQAELDALREEWPDVVEKCLVLQPLLKRDLRDSWPLWLTDTALTIGFDPEFSGVMDEVMRLDHGGLHTFFSQRLGRSIRIGYQVMKEAVTWSHHLPEEGQVEKDDPEFHIETAGDNPKEWVKNPAIRQVIEVFHGDIKEIQR
ncbi:hypothetical protein P3T73_14460 [Kiritimatiellota bacterium B12222]|nr:hypothetical protein P3T73_14460 [Kiritimatiellota bacterium B12222]